MLYSLTGKSQDSMSNRSDFILSFACLKNEIKKASDCTFILKLHNTSSVVLKAPVTYIASSTSSTNFNFGYEVFWYSKKDTVDLTLNFEELNQVPYYSFHRYTSIGPGEDLLIELGIYPGFFKRKGIYKIRFFYKAGIYNEGIDDVSTNWIYVQVKQELKLPTQ